MSKFKRNKKIIIGLLILVALVIGYFKGYPYVRDNYLPSGKLIGKIITPSVNNADFYSTEAYGGPDSPWGFYHNGIDYMASTDHQPIQAAAGGKVIRLQENFNAGSRWQVELTINHGKYDLQYAFEIFSGSKPDIDAQLSDITVKLGQNVKQGQIIGYLHRIQVGAHVHFGIAVKNQVTCPEPFFTPAARSVTLALIGKTYPGAKLCYPANPTAPRKQPTKQQNTNILSP